MKIYVVDNGTRYKESLLNLVQEFDPILVKLQDLDQGKLDENALVVLSGGHAVPVLWHDDVYANEIDVIKHHPGPIIGVCLGFEPICHVFKSHLHLMDDRRKGLVTIKPSIENEIMLPNMAIRVYENHRWSVQKLKAPLQALAYSTDGIEVFRHMDRPIFGIQFHPESEQGDGVGIFRKIVQSLANEA